MGHTVKTTDLLYHAECSILFSIMETQVLNSSNRLMLNARKFLLILLARRHQGDLTL